MTDRRIILDLCGGTGSWSKPYQEAGYDVRIITLPDYDVRTYIPPNNVYGIFAAPPCTEFSLLNCKAEPRKRYEAAGMEIVNACLQIINQCNPHFWALENPRGHLRKYLGMPKLNFQPWFYGDPWTKATDIWGNFNIPKRKLESWFLQGGKSRRQRACRKRAGRSVTGSFRWRHFRRQTAFIPTWTIMVKYVCVL